MEDFMRAFQWMLDDSKNTIHRDIYDRIDGEARLVCIRGSRGIGKTTFLLNCARRFFDTDDTRTCLYVNLNHFFFANNRLYDFIKRFYYGGGRVMLLDQIFKYPEWEEDLLECLLEFDDLRIIFTTSSVMTFEESDPVLKSMMKVYDLTGFSFREYLNFHCDMELKPYPLKEVLTNHTAIADEILAEVHPLHDFYNYLKVGYYPPIVDQVQFEETLIKNMNMVMEVEMVYIRQIEPAYLHKLRQLYYLIATEPKAMANVTFLSNEIGISRATVMNYLKYIADAGLVRLLYKEGSAYPKKPDRIYLNDTNIGNVMYSHQLPDDMVRKVFLLSQLESAGYEVYHSERQSVDFVVKDAEERYNIRTTDLPQRRASNDTYYAIENMATGQEDEIPLWLFGFLY